MRSAMAFNSSFFTRAEISDSAGAALFALAAAELTDSVLLIVSVVGHIRVVINFLYVVVLVEHI